MRPTESKRIGGFEHLTNRRMRRFVAFEGTVHPRTMRAGRALLSARRPKNNTRRSTQVKHSGIRKTAAAAFVLLGCSATTVQGANWVTSTGMEAPGAPAWRPFGFLSLEYQQTDGSRLPAGNPFAGKANVLNQIAPDLNENAELQIPFARLGVRGSLFDDKLNYFFTPLTGYNGITRNGGGIVKITDASVTLNLIPYARIRLGQFKHPSGEEAMKEPPQQEFINGSDTTNQLLQERFFDSDGNPASTTWKDPNLDNGPVSGFRDIGVQVFDAIKTGEWEHTYAVMLGQGNGLLRSDNNSDKDLYLLWASEWVFGGQGPKREGLKGYAFYQNGERKLRTGLSQVEGDFDRTRWGAGATFRKGAWYAAAEYVEAEGMIPNGTTGVAVPGTLSNNAQQVARNLLLPTDSADGYNLTGGYAIRPDWEVFLRYDRLNRGTDTALNERRFETWSVSTRYYITKSVYLVGSYEWRDFSAPRLADSAVPNTSLDTVDDRMGVRLYWTFF